MREQSQKSKACRAKRRQQPSNFCAFAHGLTDWKRHDCGRFIFMMMCRCRCECAETHVADIHSCSGLRFPLIKINMHGMSLGLFNKYVRIVRLKRTNKILSKPNLRAPSPMPESCTSIPSSLSRNFYLSRNFFLLLFFSRIISHRITGCTRTIATKTAHESSHLGSCHGLLRS